MVCRIEEGRAMLSAFLALGGRGLAVTLQVFALTLIFSLPLAVGIAQLRLSSNKILSFLAGKYIYIMRATPLLLQAMFIFFGLPFIGLTMERMPAVVTAFSLNYAAYFAEIFRGGIQAIPKGQYEAAKVLGLKKFTAFRKIILPQVVKIILPSLSNEVITLIKNTSLVYILGMSDILKVSKSISNTYASFFPYIFAALTYLLLVALLSWIFRGFEKCLAYYE